MPQTPQLGVTPDLMDHQRLEGVLEDLAQSSRGPRPVGRRVAERDDRALHGNAGGERFQDRRASDEATVDQRRTVHLDRWKQSRHGHRGQQGVVGNRLIVEQPGFAAGEVGRHDDEAQR